MKLLVAISLTITFSHVGVHSARNEPRTMTAKQKSDIVKRHNVLRAKEDAADMEMITWNETLAKGAAELVAKCRWKHDFIKLPDTNIQQYGQNMYMTNGATISMVKAVQSWYGQKPNYYFDLSRCKYNRTCAYYLQLVWARTRQVGCAYHYCDTLELSSATKAEFLVCNYIPQGNIPGTKPFKKGPPCSKCSGDAGWCTNKLCNRKCSKAGRGCSCAAHCHNCVKLNLKTCRCSCVDGWWGPDCSRRCEEKPTVCTDAYRCSDEFFENAEMLCPVKCNLCTPDPDAKPGKCPVRYGPAAHGAALTTVNSTKSPNSSDDDDDDDDAGRDQSQSQHQQQCRTLTMLSYVILPLAITIYSSIL